MSDIPRVNALLDEMEGLEILLLTLGAGAERQPMTAAYKGSISQARLMVQRARAALREALEYLPEEEG